MLAPIGCHTVRLQSAFLGGRGDEVTDPSVDFEVFVAGCRRRLWLATVPVSGPTVADDAVADAFEWAWRHWDRISAMENPEGYLYRMAQRSAAKRRTDPLLPAPPPGELTDVEPGLVPALARLSSQQRTVVWLVEGCGWGLTDVARMLDVSVSSVRTHLARALDRLREDLEVDIDAPR